MNDERRTRRPPAPGEIRRSDVEPYTALRWVATLFKAAAVFLAVAIVGEFVAGIRLEGMAALPLLMGELARTAVLAVVLWGGGDMVRLLVHLGHDIRAQRILLGRVATRLTGSDEATAGSHPDEAEMEPEEASGTPRDAAAD